MTTSRRRRAGFTLLELLLASAIAVLLMAALYSAFNLVLRRTEVNREAVAASDLSRAIVNRLTADLSQSAGLLPPMTSQNSFQQSSGSSSGSAASSTSTDAVDTSSDIPFPCGLVGTDKQVSIYCVRVPTALTDPDALANPDRLRPGDLRCVRYYLGGNGLCRQERPWVTADGVRNSSDPDLSTADTDVIAPEVTDATFEYFSGGVWNAEWDGTQTGTDGVTQQGPPRAVRVTLQLSYPMPAGGTRQKTVVHVIPIRAAVGSYLPDDGTATTTTTTGGS